MRKKSAHKEENGTYAVGLWAAEAAVLFFSSAERTSGSSSASPGLRNLGLLRCSAAAGTPMACLCSTRACVVGTSRVTRTYQVQARAGKSVRELKQRIQLIHLPSHGTCVVLVVVVLVGEEDWGQRLHSLVDGTHLLRTLSRASYLPFQCSTSFSSCPIFRASCKHLQGICPRRRAVS